MKLTILIVWTIILTVNCDSNNQNSNSENLVDISDVNKPNEEIYSNPQFSIDSTKWISKDKNDVINFFNKILPSKPNFSADQIIGLFTLTETPVVSYPNIFILDNTMDTNPPSMDQLARELKAIPAVIESKLSNDQEISDVINEAKLEQPLLIREKNLILIEANAKRKEGVEIGVRQAMFFKKRKLIAVQFSYIKGRDDKHLIDFNKIVESFKM